MALFKLGFYKSIKVKLAAESKNRKKQKLGKKYDDFAVELS